MINLNIFRYVDLNFNVSLKYFILLNVVYIKSNNGYNREISYILYHIENLLRRERLENVLECCLVEAADYVKQEIKHFKNGDLSNLFYEPAPKIEALFILFFILKKANKKLNREDYCKLQIPKKIYSEDTYDSIQNKIKLFFKSIDIDELILNLCERIRVDHRINIINSKEFL